MPDRAPRCPNPECGDHMLQAHVVHGPQTREVYRCRNQSCRAEVPLPGLPGAWKPVNTWAEAREVEGWC